MKKLIFFNQFHNGDCFVGKEYVAEMTRLLGPDIEYFYAHNNHADIIKDIEELCNIKHIGLNNIPPMDRMTKVAESPDKETVFVNTWVGCWQGQLFPFGEHINFIRLHNIWREYFRYFKLEFVEEPDYYLPQIDFSKYDLKQAHEFLRGPLSHLQKILVCNGNANSGQSRVGNLKQTIIEIANTFPDHLIIATEKLDFRMPNVVYTDEIFTESESDINLIAYISQFCKLIVGKNSGPFSYCQFKDNLNNKDSTFLNLSILPTDCPSGGSAYAARCIFSPETNEDKIANLIYNIIEAPQLRGTEILL